MRKTVFLVAISATMGSLIFSSGIPSSAAPVGTPSGQGKTLDTSPEPSDPLTLESGGAREKLMASSHYGGQWIDRKTGVIHVLMTSGGESEARAGVQGIAHQHIQIETVGQSYASLIRQRDAVSDDIPDWAARKIELVDWGPDETANKLAISVRELTPEKEALLRAKYGDVIVSAGDTTPRNAGLSRTADTTPYSGGIHLSDFFGTVCTSGPAIVRGGSRYLLTAAHCYKPTVGTYNNGVLIGTANWVDQSTNGTDTEILTAPGSPSFYRTETTFTTAESTPWTSSPGETVCFGGSWTGEVCNNEVVQSPTNYCTTTADPPRTTCGFTTAGRNGTQPAGKGDSGGPVYILSPGHRYSGTISSAASALVTCNVNPQPWRTCADFVRFQMITTTLSHWGATLP